MRYRLNQCLAPKGLPFVGTLFTVLANFGGGNKLIMENHAKYGPIYKEKAGPYSLVMIKDADVVKKMLHSEGKYPKRIAVIPWNYWRERKNIRKGVLMENDGPQWRKMRSLLDKKMMRPFNMKYYAHMLNGVNADFIDQLRRIRKDDLTIDNLDQEMFKWSFENIASVMFERRLGAVSESPSQETVQFIQAVNNMFESTEHIVYLPGPLAKFFSPKWYKKHDDGWTTIFTIGKKLIDQKIAEIEEKMEAGEEVEGFLAGLIGQENLSRDELYSNMADMMAAAVDTTSNTMQVLVYFLAKNPECQKRIREEIQSVIHDPSRQPTYADINDMPFVRAVAREVLRLYPPASGPNRILDDEIELGGYRIPANTLLVVNTYVSSMDPEIFPDPEEFRPERWLRDSEERDSIHPFASLPFGYGQRGCIGRRIAELEIQLLTTQLCRHFDLAPGHDKPIEFCTRLLVVPKQPVLAKFIDRM